MLLEKVTIIEKWITFGSKAQRGGFLSQGNLLLVLAARIFFPWPKQIVTAIVELERASSSENMLARPKGFT